MMKPLLAAALLGAGTAATAQALPPAVIVVVDLDAVVNTSAAGRQAGTELQTRIQALQARANTLQTQLQTEGTAIQTGQQNNSLAGAALEQRVRAFEQRQNAARDELGRGDQEIQRARNFVIQQINTAAQPIITAIMRERGASIALADNATIQVSSSLNVTNDVIARLNTSLPRVSTTPPAQPAQGAAPAQTPARPATPPAATPPRR
jgi:Skp family chaperone for outer membrane proteins